MAEFEKNIPRVLAVGNFDGVHTAHRQLLRITAGQAASRGVKSAALTFSPHPKIALGYDMPLLADDAEKQRLILETGVDEVIFHPCTEKFLENDGAHFINDIIAGEYGALGLVVGFNFRFGKNASDGTEALVALCIEAGIDVMVMSRFVVGKTTVSSSAVRRALIDGDPEKANLFLGRNFTILGQVIKGRRIGREIGFPTLNVALDSKLIHPKNGVYTAFCSIDGEKLPGVLNIGVNPTVSGDKAETRAEIHLLNYSESGGEAYGAHIKIELINFIRGERLFPDKSALSAQIEKDIETAKILFDKV